MNTSIGSIVTLLVTVAVLATASATLHHRAKLVRSVACQQQAGPVLPATAYSDLVNGLSMGGR
jgi:hypothetical protein